MNKFIPYIFLSAVSSFLFSCKKDVGSLNGPTVEQFSSNASVAELNNLVSGTESGMRNYINLYLDDVGTIGREIYRFSASEPRYVTDLLGASSATLSNSNFYITNPWAARYRVVKNCNILVQSAQQATAVSSTDKKGYIGFAQTIKAYQLLMNLNLTDSNGIRLNVDDPDNLGPIVGYDAALTAISNILDSGNTSLQGATVPFVLAGFGGFNDAAGLAKVNRALAARVELYRGNWDNALTNLSASFFSLTAPFYTGVTHVFANGSGDQINPVFIPQNLNGEVRVAHPSYAANIAAGDDRISKATLRTATASLNGLSSNRDVWVYTSSTAPIYIIRNEELILIYAEAHIQKNDLGTAVNAINIIRTGHNLGNYTGAVTQAALIDELLTQRRFSLYYEGHRWVDLRRYNRLSQLPIDRVGDDVWTKFPIPVSEQ